MSIQKQVKRKSILLAIVSFAIWETVYLRDLKSVTFFLDKSDFCTWHPLPEHRHLTFEHNLANLMTHQPRSLVYTRWTLADKTSLFDFNDPPGPSLAVEAPICFLDKRTDKRTPCTELMTTCSMGAWWVNIPKFSTNVSCVKVGLMQENKFRQVLKFQSLRIDGVIKTKGNGNLNR